jgi:hypothetical protein
MAGGEERKGSPIRKGADYKEALLQKVANAKEKIGNRERDKVQKTI